MRETALRALLVLALVATQNGCGLMQPRKESATETPAERFGPYCEQLGNLKDTPGYDACIRNMRSIYK